MFGCLEFLSVRPTRWEEWTPFRALSRARMFGMFGFLQQLPARAADWAWLKIGHSLTPRKYLVDGEFKHPNVRRGRLQDETGGRGLASLWFSGVAETMEAGPGKRDPAARAQAPVACRTGDGAFRAETSDGRERATGLASRIGNCEIEKRIGKCDLRLSGRIVDCRSAQPQPWDGTGWGCLDV